VCALGGKRGGGGVGGKKRDGRRSGGGISGLGGGSRRKGARGGWQETQALVPEGGWRGLGMGVGI